MARWLHPVRGLGSAREDRDAGVGTAADGLGEADGGPLDLAGAGAALQLVDELDHLADGRGAEGLALRQQPATGVDRYPPAVGGVAPVQQVPGAAGLAQ